MACSNQAYEEHSIYDCDRTLSTYTPETFISEFDAIYMDFNGSMAFFDPEWESVLYDAAGKIKAVVIMGGVYSDKEPQTMPAIPSMNRVSCATMNQLYHKEHTDQFFVMLDLHKVKVFIVANNDVDDLVTFADTEKKVKSDLGWTRFLKANGLDSPFLKSISSAYYNSQYTPPRKAFDYYTAMVVTYMIRHEKEDNNLVLSKRNVFFNSETGATIISDFGKSRNTALGEYIRNIELLVANPTTPPIKKDAFPGDISRLKQTKKWKTITASTFQFGLDKKSYGLGVACVVTVYPNASDQ
jgi:hypothetical protein